METLVLAAHVILAAGIIGLVLLQQGKGAEAGASFGGGASQTVFGSQGTGTFLSKMTAVLATGLFVTSFVLAIYAKQQAEAVSDRGIPTVETVAEPALPVLEEPKKVTPADADVPKAN